MSKVASLGLGKYQKEQSHKFWWTYLQLCGSSRRIHGSLGQYDPESCEIGLSSIWTDQIESNTAASSLLNLLSFVILVELLYNG